MSRLRGYSDCIHKTTEGLHLKILRELLTKRAMFGTIGPIPSARYTKTLVFFATAELVVAPRFLWFILEAK